MLKAEHQNNHLYHWGGRAAGKSGTSWYALITAEPEKETGTPLARGAAPAK